MRFMLLMSYEEIPGVPPIDQWDRKDIAAHVAFQQRLGQELAGRGELVGGEGLAQPQTAKLVIGDGANPPVIREWPFDEHHKHLAGTGCGGKPIRQPIEVRAVVGPGS